MKVDNIVYDNRLIAVLIYNSNPGPGVHFYTPDAGTLQVARHGRLKGDIIKAHKHVPVKIKRDESLQEVLYIETGKMKITFYGDHQEVIESKILNKGDMILLIEGGHGFEFLEETRMIEIKQGPYIPESKRTLGV